ncbi:Hypothetical predicted protein [Pelobates cultripes]|uniref:Helix-turn-helix domain-containing protein n=1 Tax=Pelobates cultripes TaxID=61616 RepID=A0AAD1SK52_PELCU|nr:Hypothetical predicted protein [Pelobates cultripes]
MYANSFMHSFEEDNILKKFGKHIIKYLCFINDILIIWNGDDQSFINMMSALNALNSPVKLPSQWSTTQIDFLDLQIYIEGNRLGYTLYSKDIDRNSILHASSFHPRRLKESLPISQFLRVLRNNSDSTKASKQVQQMYQKFQERGYTHSILTTALQQAYKLIEEPMGRTEIGDV